MRIPLLYFIPDSSKPHDKGCVEGKWLVIAAEHVDLKRYSRSWWGEEEDEENPHIFQADVDVQSGKFLCDTLEEAHEKMKEICNE